METVRHHEVAEVEAAEPRASGGPMDDETEFVDDDAPADRAAVEAGNDDALDTAEPQATPPYPNAFDRLASGTQATTAGRHGKGGTKGAGTQELDDENMVLDVGKNNNQASHRGPPPDDAVSCSVCLEPCSINGTHQVTSLHCGHVFGHDCIYQWLDRKKKGNGGKCPQCGQKASVKDLRKLFVPNFHAFVDIDEVEQLKQQLSHEKANRVNAEMTAISVSRRLIKVEKELSDSIENVKTLEAELDAARKELKNVRIQSSASGDTNTVAPLFRINKRQKQHEPQLEKENVNSLRNLMEPSGRKNIGSRATDDDDREDSATWKKRIALESRTEHYKTGKFVPRAAPKLQNAKAFDINQYIAAVGERADASLNAKSFLTKMSLRNVNSKIRVQLPNGTGNVRDVRLSNGGTSNLTGNSNDSYSDRTLALCATLGKKLLVVDCQRDHVACKLELPREAWSCAWGGWSTYGENTTGSGNATVALPGGDFKLAPSAANDANSQDPSGNSNLCSVGLANGEVLMYDLRNVSTFVARIAPPEVWPGNSSLSELKPVHSVIPLSREDGGGLLFGNLNGARYWRHADASTSSQLTFDNSIAGVCGEGGHTSAPDKDASGIITKLPYVNTCESALAYHPGSKTLVATMRYPFHGFTYGTHTVLTEWSVPNHGNPDSVSTKDTDHFLWTSAPSQFVTQRRVSTTRIALTGSRHKSSLPGLIACGSSGEGNAPAHVTLTDALSGEIVSTHEHGGSGSIDDVRGWCGDGVGQLEVLASLSGDAMTVFSWDQ